MAHDPLSTATRAAKRNLLVASSVLILTKAFNVTVQKIPALGYEVNIGPGALLFALIISTFYFFITFTLYYGMDIYDEFSDGYSSKHLKSEADELSRLSEAHEADIIKMCRYVMSDVEFSVDQAGLKRLIEILRSDKVPDITSDRVDKLIKIYKPLVLTVKKGNGSDNQYDIYAQEQGFRSDIADAVVSQKALASGLITNYAVECAAIKSKYGKQTRFRSSLHFVRAYIVDGALALIVGIIAIGVSFNKIPLGWITSLLPEMIP
ncbi:hypothetical protein [Azospirillum isscasi]|uniref:Uncharacterized protein n=1 Tax=Azospirillum isscasi TaxID=3053926 RepID=A0ABU0WQJ8_9PROT|nr:hypothetical protein [Azospirillum isscasi]MDQ2106518.1 hypothetical protein [Azospirillum isscasi]